jgi:hypothetical protein
MVRSLRASSLALLAAFALVGWGCSSSSNPPNSNKDGGSGDSHIIQLDGPNNHEDAQQVQNDADPSVCNPTSGSNQAGLCKLASDCKCPLECDNLWADQGSAGSCWPICTGTSDCPNGICTAMDSTSTNMHCFPKGTLAANWSGIVLYDANDTSAALGGSVTNTSIVAGDVNVTTFQQGMAFHDATKHDYEIYLIGAAGSKIGILFIVVTDEASWNTTAQSMDLTQSTTKVIVQYVEGTQGSSGWTSLTVKAFADNGTFTLSSAPTTLGQTVAGTITNGEAFEYVVEQCGTHSTACN